LSTSNPGAGTPSRLSDVDRAHQRRRLQLSILRQMLAAIDSGDAEQAFLLVLEYQNADWHGQYCFDLSSYPEVVFVHDACESKM
jgi:hypothetical protein